MTRRPKAIICAVAAVVVAAVIFVYNPAETRWMPRCLLLTLTGYRCPSCGITRAAHQLMHGHFSEALMLNPMLPVLLVLAAVIIYRLLMPRTHRYRTTLILIYIYLAVYCAWGIIRNIMGI